MPFTREDLEAIADSIATAKGMDPALGRRLIQRESGWNPNARSPVGAMGLTQLMPGTAEEMGVTDPWDPRQNIGGGFEYYQRQKERFGDDRLASAAYNAGPGAVEEHGGVPPYKETQGYVDAVAGPAGGGGVMTVPQLQIPEELLQTLMERIQGAFGNADQDVLGAERSGAETEARMAQAKLEETAQAPVESTNPESDLWSRTLGNISDVLGQGGAGIKGAEMAIQTEKAGFMQRRINHLKALSDAAERTADRAAKLGNLEAEMKARTQAERASKQAEAVISAFEQHNLTQREAMQQEGANERARLEREQRAKSDAEQNTSNERVARIQKGINPDTNEPLTLNPSSWLTSDAQAKHRIAIRNSVKNRNGGVDTKKYKAAFISGYAPNKSQKVEDYLKDIINEREPGNPSKFLFNSKDTEAIKEMLRKRYGTQEDQVSIESWKGIPE